MIALTTLAIFLVATPLALGTAKAVLIALDQLVNAYFRGWPDETISSRAWRWERSGKRVWPRKLIDALFFWDANHCRESYESELIGRQLPPEMRQEEQTP